jgi:release factor glutamine methyltransferase
MLAEVLGCRRAGLYAYPKKQVSASETAQFCRMMARRCRHEPLQYILGYEEFFGLRIEVSPDVLIPRPETEEVVEDALYRLKDVARPKVLDIGTGSGCIALAIKHIRPDATVYACDVSPDALAVARRNARLHDAAVQFFEADVLRDALTEHIGAPLDLTVSNPPYIPDAEARTLPRDVREHEPAAALLAGADALRFYRAIAHQASRLLKEEGWLVLETHAHYAEEVRDLLRRQRAAAVEMKHDLSGRARMVAAQPSIHAGHSG